MTIDKPFREALDMEMKAMLTRLQAKGIPRQDRVAGYTHTRGARATSFREAPTPIRNYTIQNRAN